MKHQATASSNTHAARSWRTCHIISAALALALLTGCATGGSYQTSRSSVDMMRQENDHKEAENKRQREEAQRRREEKYSQWFNNLPKKDQNRLLASKQRTDEQNQADSIDTATSILDAAGNAVKPDVYIDRR